MAKVSIAAFYKGGFAVVCKLSLLLGLLPAPLRAFTHGMAFAKSCRLYILYSFMVHVLFVALEAVTMMFSHDFKLSGVHRTRNPIIFVTSYSAEYLAIFYVLMILREVWWRRSEYRRAYAKYCQWTQRMHAYWRDTRIPIHPGRRRAVTRLMESFVIQRIFVLLSLLFIVAFVVAQMRPLDNVWSVFLFSVNMEQMVIGLLAMCLFTFVMSKLWQHFAHINMMLAEMLEMLNSGSTPVSSDALTGAADELNTLFGLHMQLHGIAVEAFSLVNVPFLINMAQWFLGNVRSVQMIMYLVTGIFSFDSSYSWLLPLGNVMQHCDTWYLIQNVENVLEACNSTGEILVEFNQVAAVHRNKDLRQTVETFSSYLRCHKLKYMVCGLFDFSRRASFAYIAAIIMQVTVVMQFDMAMSPVYQPKPQPQSEN